MSAAPAKASSVPQEPGCGVCRGLAVVTYSRSSPDRPAPFCGACRRELGLVLVDDAPWHWRRPAGRTQEKK